MANGAAKAQKTKTKSKTQTPQKKGLTAAQKAAAAQGFMAVAPFGGFIGTEIGDAIGGDETESATEATLKGALSKGLEGAATG